ncbi:hypothetical protein RchiOBHm_Chr4g0410511 [Rosa chinensis]|uniref:Uncharacterized protein n=1 Tax=Rosa chinensis TaxID=74649 RepID=A0A2P6QVE5_ROSCH|nr:hypothetical protein RchiOBHm_Chr4g0410511 [Rosa chinensis]
MNCGRCSNEKKMTVTVAVLRQRRYFPIPAISGHQIGVEGAVFPKDHVAPSLEP